MSLCILAAGKVTVLAVSAFTLSWTHSVEKVRWEEDWLVTPAGLDPLNWLVITPKAASCTSCHDSTKAIDHVVGAGGSSFGQLTQAQSLQTQETCADCHALGRPQGVDVVHK